MDDVEVEDRSARLLTVAHAVKVAVEPADVILREVTTNCQGAAAALPLDSVTQGVEVEEDIVIPVLPHAATLTLAKCPAAETCCLGDI